MPTKAEKEREARIQARKKEADKKAKERKEKEAKIIKRIESHRAETFKAQLSMLKCGVIVEVLNTVQAKLAQDAGFNAICPYNFPATIVRNPNGNPITSDPRAIRDMMNSVAIPIMANVRTGHIIEAQMAEYLGACIINEHEYAGIRTATHMPKDGFKVPFMAGVATLTECFMRIEEGATMLRTKDLNRSFAYTLSTIMTIFDTLAAMKTYQTEYTLYMDATAVSTAAAAAARDAKSAVTVATSKLNRLLAANDPEKAAATAAAGVAIDVATAASEKATAAATAAKDAIEALGTTNAALASINARKALLARFKKEATLKIIDTAIQEGKLPVQFYGYGGVCTPNDVAMLRKVGCGAIISNIAFRADNPRRRLKKLVEASTSYSSPSKMVELSIGTNEQPIAAPVRRAM